MLLLFLACTADKTDSSSTDGPNTSTTTGPTTDTGDSTTSDPSHFFPSGAPWYQDVSGADVDPTSPSVIGALQSHGWGFDRFQIDFSIEVLEADASTPKMSFTPTGDFYSPDCDNVPFPIPEGGIVEGEEGYACTNDGDCHLLVVDREEQQLFEMWRADIRGDTFRGGCAAVWDMSKVYPEDGRGDQCTSADAAGYPITPLLFTADEVAAGEISHAIRFILPNDIIRDGVFYHPATHATNAEGGGATAVPYGAHLRLKPDFDMSRLPNESSRVIARALQKYGMFLADGGNVALTGRSDRSTEHTWEEVEIDSHSLVGIEPQDFEMLALGKEVALTFDCKR